MHDPAAQRKDASNFQSLNFWIKVGVVCFLLQFGTSELLYRASMMGILPAEEQLSVFSDLISWPAQPMYAMVEEKLMEEALAEVALGGFGVTEEQKQQAIDFLEAYPEFPPEGEREEISSFLWDIPGVDVAITVSIPVEYAIYMGACAGWALLISMGGFLLFRNMDPEVM